MSGTPTGPIQWTQAGGFVPAMTTSAGAGPIGSHVAPVVDSDDDDDDDAEVSSPTNLPRRPSRVFAPVKKQAAPVKPRSIVVAAKARLRDIEKELRRLKRLESERDELRRLVDAANNKPRAIVREIKRSAG